MKPLLLPSCLWRSVAKSVWKKLSTAGRVNWAADERDFAKISVNFRLGFLKRLLPSFIIDGKTADANHAFLCTSAVPWADGVLHQAQAGKKKENAVLRKKGRCPLPGLNQRPLDLQSNALPAELRELTAGFFAALSSFDGSAELLKTKFSRSLLLFTLSSPCLMKHWGLFI